MLRGVSPGAEGRESSVFLPGAAPGVPVPACPVLGRAAPRVPHPTRTLQEGEGGIPPFPPTQLGWMGRLGLPPTLIPLESAGSSLPHPHPHPPEIRAFQPGPVSLILILPISGHSSVQEHFHSIQPHWRSSTWISGMLQSRTQILRMLQSTSVEKKSLGRNSNSF